MLTKEELDQINRFSKAELTADQVYTFSVRLCDNEVDRDFERFGTEDLERLGELFLGKSGIFDHQWSAKGQTAWSSVILGKVDDKLLTLQVTLPADNQQQAQTEAESIINTLTIQ